MTGVGYYTQHLFEALMARDDGPDLRILASNAGRLPEELATFGARASRYKALRFPTRWKNMLWTRWEWPRMDHLLGRTDIVHGAFHLLPPSRHAKRVVTVFDLAGMRRANVHEDSALSLHRQLLEHAIPRAAGIFAISRSCRDDVIELLGAEPERVHVVPGGVVLDEFTGPIDEERLAAAKARFGIAGPYLIHLGTLEPRKNLPRFIEAYARLRERHGPLPQLVLAGGKGWMYEPIFEAIAAYHLEEAVIWTDYLSREDAVALLRGARGCVYPSLYEGFGLPALEAMAARVPVLTSDVSSLPEVVGDTGILVSPEEGASIEAGLERLLFETDTEAVRVEAARRRAEGMTWDHSAASLLRAYRAVLDGAGAQP